MLAVAGGPDLWTLAVPGGWLVTFDDQEPSLAFVPDPEHRWFKPKALDTTATAE
jgi:hypothetical protein